VRACAALAGRWMARTVELAGRPASVRNARVFTADVLGEGGVEASVIELAVLLVSELVTNAIHAGGDARMTVHFDAHWVRIEVEDKGRGRPLLRPFTPHSPNGRGLGVVDALATDWGTERHTNRKVVWFEIAR
jgi:anti-sigma regulatory factor (Ser/Thr protein kinase)